jgi:hypothetical protein
MSYTKFVYSNPKITGIGTERRIEFTLHNAGSRDGEDVP